jgi:hypothetical protein
MYFISKFRLDKKDNDGLSLLHLRIWKSGYGARSEICEWELGTMILEAREWTGSSFDIWQGKCEARSGYELRGRELLRK